MHRRPPTSVFSSVAQTFGARSCSLKNRAVARDILKKSVYFIDQEIQGLALELLLVEGSVAKPVAPPIFENCAPVRDILKILHFSDFINIQNLRSRTRQFDFLKFRSSSYCSVAELQTQVSMHWSAAGRSTAGSNLQAVS